MSEGNSVETLRRSERGERIKHSDLMVERIGVVEWNNLLVIVVVLVRMRWDLRRKREDRKAIFVSRESDGKVLSEYGKSRGFSL